MYFAYFHSFAPPKPSNRDNYQMIMTFLETRYKNGPGNGRRSHHSKLRGWFLANVVTWYFPKIIKIHPVELNMPYIVAVLDLLLSSFSVIELLLAPVSSLSSKLSWPWPRSAPACLAYLWNAQNHNKHVFTQHVSFRGDQLGIQMLQSVPWNPRAALRISISSLLVTQTQTYPNQTVWGYPDR